MIVEFRLLMVVWLSHLKMESTTSNLTQEGTKSVQLMYGTKSRKMRIMLAQAEHILFTPHQWPAATCSFPKVQLCLPIKWFLHSALRASFKVDEESKRFILHRSKKEREHQWPRSKFSLGRSIWELWSKSLSAGGGSKVSVRVWSSWDRLRDLFHQNWVTVKSRNHEEQRINQERNLVR